MNLAKAFFETASLRSDKVALFWGEAEYTYRHFAEQASWLAAQLQNQFGVKPGDRVAIWLKNCPEFVTALFGALNSGAVVVPINNFLKSDEVSFILNDAGIDVVISDCSMAEAFASLVQSRSSVKFLRVEDIVAAAEGSTVLPACASDASESDLAVIIYTSGTTGRPKGAMLTHGNLLSNVEACHTILEATDADRFAVLLPMFHSFMLTVGILLPLTKGSSVLVIKSLHPPKNIIMEILQRQATILPAVPQFFRAFTHAPLPPNLPLRLCISGGAPLPGEILKEFTEKFPIPLIEGYGLSEASPVVTFNPLRGPRKAGSIGTPIPGVEVTVQSDAGEILPGGETGEICVRGPNVMKGYWNQPEESSKALRNGWLLTGDVGHQDEDGYFFITDRKKDMLLVNGINVYPREIEEVIYQFPGVKEAAVIGKPDARKGEQPVAFVSANEGAAVDEKALQQFLREKLADYKVPRRIVSLPTLPRNATGKILKTALREIELS